MKVTIAAPHALRFDGHSIAGSGPLNLGNPDELTLRELADLVIELLARSRK
jgi:hypothetical protein